jgi:hypothetical protein
VRVDVQGCASHEPSNERGRIIYLGIQIRVDRLLESMERDLVSDEPGEPAVPFVGRTMEFKLRANFRARGRVEADTPFAIQIGDDVRELTTARAVRHFSFRRMAAIAELEPDQQRARFADLRAGFSAA